MTERDIQAAIRLALGQRTDVAVWRNNVGLAERASCEAREGVAVTVDCDDGWRRYVDPARLRPELRLVSEGER